MTSLSSKRLFETCVHQLFMITSQLPRAGNGGSHNFSLEYQTQSNNSLKLNCSFITPGLYKGLALYFFLHACFKTLVQNFVSLLAFSQLQSQKKPFSNFSSSHGTTPHLQ